MPWSGSGGAQSFSRNNGTHTGTQTWQEDAAEPANILASRHDTHDQDIADGVNACLKKDGGNTATADIPMGGFKFTNVGVAAARTDFTRFSDAQDNKHQYVSAVAGTVDVITLTPAIAITAYAAGQRFTFKAVGANTGAVTVNVSSVGAKSVVWPNGTALVSADIASGSIVDIEYDGTNFQMLNSPQGVAAVGVGIGTVMAWPGTASVPTGWLECDGSSLAVASYTALHAAIGYAYGGSGANFNLPNYKDYFLRGFDASGTDAGSRTDRGDGTTGASIGTKQAAAVRNHAHTGTTAGGGEHFHFSVNSDSLGSDVIAAGETTASAANHGNSNSYILGGSATAPDRGKTDTVANHTHTFTTDQTGDSANETRAKNITVKWIILAERAASIPVSAIGRNETWIGARSMTARVNNGAGSATRDSGASDITQPVFDFDASADEFVQFEWAPPKRWNDGTVTAAVYWTNDAGLTTETVRFTLAGVAISNDDALNATFGTAVDITDTWIAQGDLHIADESGAVTIGGTPANADLVVFQLGRDVSEDNLTGDARVLGIKLFWNSNATTDD